MNSREMLVSLGARSTRGPLRNFAVAVTTLSVVAFSGMVHAQEKKDPTAPPIKLTLGQIIEETGQGVVLLSVQNKKGVKIGFGSGFLVNDKGWVATNFHVVDSASRIEAQFRDGTKVGVKGLLAYDKKADLAIIELEKTPEKAKPLPMGPRKPPSQGDTVTAMGHPSGLNFSATNGIVSAVRKLPEDGEGVKPEEQHNWVQTTAMIAGGSSGGPLVSDSGQVVGINTLVATGQSIAFAMHVSYLLDLRDKAVGATIQPLPGDPASELFEPLAQLEPRIREMFMEYQNALNEYERARIRAGVLGMFTPHPGPKYAERFVHMAERERRSTLAFQALYMACLVDSAESAVFLKKSLNLLIEDYIKERWLKAAISGLSRQPQEAVTAFLRQVLEKSPHADVRGTTCYYLAVRLSGMVKPVEADYLPLLKRCADEFKDVRVQIVSENRGYEFTAAELVKSFLFAAENLSVGKKAPDIVGKDVEGKEFKLSDFRGKVVVLDFFADWCPFCVKMYPEERELVKAMADKPFALLGVNCDSEDTLRQLIADKKVTWTCWSDGKEGPISIAWQLDAYPTVYVIDQDGVIRHKFQGGTKPGELKAMVGKMVDALQPAAKKEDEKPK